MTKLEWKEVFRPFLEQEPSRTLPLWPLLREALMAALATAEEEEEEADIQQPVGSLANAMAKKRAPLEEEMADRVLARALKVLCHVVSDRACTEAFFAWEPTAGEALEEARAGNAMEVDTGEERGPRRGCRRVLSLPDTLRAALLCSEGSSQLSGEMRDPCIRTEGLHLLRTLLQWPETFEEAAREEVSCIGLSHLLDTALSCLSDANFRISEEAVELIAVLILSPCQSIKREVSERCEDVVMNGELGSRMQRMCSGLEPARVTVALVNVVQLLVCPSTLDSDPGIDCRGLRFVEKYSLVERLLPHLLSTDRLLRFRIVELVEDISRAGLHRLCFPGGKHAANPDAHMVSGLAQLLHLEQVASGDAPSYLLSLAVELSGILATKSSEARYAVVKRLYEPVIDFVVQLLFTRDASGCLVPAPSLPLHRATLSTVGVCTRALQATTRLLEKDLSVLASTGPHMLPELSSIVSGLLEHPLFESTAALSRAALLTLRALNDKKILDRGKLALLLVKISSTRQRPVAVISSALELLAAVLLEDEGAHCSVVASAGETAQLLIYHPSPQYREAALKFLLSLIPSKKLYMEMQCGSASVEQAWRGLVKDEDDLLRARAVSGLADVGRFPWAASRWTNAEVDDDDMVSLILLALQDEADGVRRAALEVLHAWTQEECMLEHLYAALHFEQHISTLSAALSAAAEDIDWEVKRRLACFLGALLSRLASTTSELLQRIGRTLFTSTDALKLLIILAEDYDRVARKDTLLELAKIKSCWALAKREQITAIPPLEPFLEQLKGMDCTCLAQECSLEAVYPDETDMRFAASEIENPPDCY